MSDNKKFRDTLLKDRYFYKPNNESSWADVCNRVSKFVANGDKDKECEYSYIMQLKEFSPATPILMSSGTKRPMLSSCFVLPIQDSMKSILKALSDAGEVTCAGGGIGFDFSNIRPEGSYISSIDANAALGPIGVLKMINGLVSELKQSGRRKGACLGSISIYHDDIIKWIKCKDKDGDITNFNLSVLIDNKFMNNIVEGDPDSRKLFKEICKQAVKTGDPGILFYDNINSKSPFAKHNISITTANTCGEIPMPSYGNCLLGSVNLSKFVDYDTREFEYKRFEKVFDIAYKFLNDCIDVNILPLQELQDFMKKYRQIGLGITGFHDALILQKIKYGSEESYEFAHKIGKVMKSVADINKKIYKNTTALTLAPTGSISIILGCSFSIEPILFKEMTRLYIDNNGVKHKFKLVHPLWQNRYKLGIPDDIFVESMDIDPADHLKMVSVFQQYIDNAISKTIMLPSGSTESDVADIFISAWQQGLKGITVYVDQSKTNQIYSDSKGDMEPPQQLLDGDKKNIGISKKKRPKKERPKVLNGKTYKCRNSNGIFYLTINEHDGTAFEIFSTPNIPIDLDRSRASETIINIEALTRIISLCLRCGIEAKVISEQLQKVKGQCLTSLPKQIADILSEFKPLNGNEKNKKLTYRLCNNCNTLSLMRTDDCWYCVNCGWSQCS